jgi:hypothetical protein
MIKLAHARDLAPLLTKTAHVCRNLAAENRELKVENASYKRREELQKVAGVAIERGTMEDADIGSFVDRWADDATPLEVLADFVNRTPAGVPLARLEHEKVAGVSGIDGEADVLTTFLATHHPSGGAGF